MTAITDVYGNLRLALKTALASVPGIPDPTRWAVGNGRFKPADLTITDGDVTCQWLRETLVPNVNNRASIGSTNYLVRHTGTWMVDFFFPENTGEAAADALLGQVLAVFTPGAQLTANGQVVRIRRAYPSGGIADTPWYQRPFTVSWIADTLTT